MKSETATTTLFLRQGGGTIAYDDAGSGPLVVCVPGIGEVRAEYRFLRATLREAGYRVVTMDVRGHGESSAGWDDYSVAGVGADIVALLHQLGAGPALVVGNSMGCAAAIWAAAEAPALVAGLVLTGPAVRDGAPSAFARLLYTVLFARPWGVALWGQYYRTLYKTTRPADFDAYIRALLSNLRQPGRLAALRRMVLAPKAAATARIGRVQAPALVVMGTRDPDFKDPVQEAQWLAQELGARLVLIDGAGHYPHVERPAETNPPIVAFLAGLQTPQPREAVAGGA